MSSNPSPEAMSAAERLCNGRRIFIDDGGWCDASEIAEIIDAAYAERLERLERAVDLIRGSGWVDWAVSRVGDLDEPPESREYARKVIEAFGSKEQCAALSAPSEGDAK